MSMTRFQSGYFFRHPLMMDYEYYWRVEPGVSYHCDIDYDVFALMAAKKYKYGMTGNLYRLSRCNMHFYSLVDRSFSF